MDSPIGGSGTFFWNSPFPSGQLQFWQFGQDPNIGDWEWLPLDNPSAVTKNVLPTDGLDARMEMPTLAVGRDGKPFIAWEQQRFLEAGGEHYQISA